MCARETERAKERENKRAKERETKRARERERLREQKRERTREPEKERETERSLVSFCFITFLFFLPYLFFLLTAALFVNNSDCVLRNSAIRTIRYGVGFEPVQNHVCKAPPPPPPPRRACYQPAARADYKTTYYDNEMVSEGHCWPGKLWGEGARQTDRQADSLTH